MSADASTFAPGPTSNTVKTTDGRVLTAPDGWFLLPPGDAALTRRVKAAGDHWIVQEKKGRKVFSKGVWAPPTTFDRIRAELAAERSTEGFAKRKQADARRREKAQVEYVKDFQGAVVSVLLAFIAAATLKASEKTPHGAKGPGHFAMGIATESLDAWRQKLQEKGVAIEDEVKWPKGGRSIYFRDPANNCVELATPGVWGLPSGW